ncbi:MAG: tRNA pseudouridine(38-40) synthase TruA [Burkholderiales bacterium]|jgi:tRNA pseudouridine38-40 synthase|nr:tRNA pseudouridine(38-40) synthase TruA [Burkholderiales bacterium]
MRTDVTAAAPRRVAIGIEYDGRSFSGWQTQPGRTGVQDALEAALAAIAGAPVATICAGRTDAGVHASGQVVHFDPPVRRPDSAWTRGVNAHLPPAVSVLWAVEPASDDFHARFSATARRYRYRLLARAARPGRLVGRVGWWHGALDVDAMQAAARPLLGYHDFSAFRAAECQAKTPLRTLRCLDVAIDADGLVRFDVEADAFLQHMVRNLVGTLVYVGAGRRPVEWPAAVLAGRDRRAAAPTFAPDGLELAAVAYPARHGLPSPPCV